MPSPNDVVLDTWSPLSHKQFLEGGKSSSDLGVAPTWVAPKHRRRLNAYTLLNAYRRNVSRWWLRDGGTDTKKQRREYGDAELIIVTIRAAILGEDHRFVVDHAGDEVGEPPTEADVVDGGPTLQELQADHAARAAEVEAAQARQEWFDKWVHDEQVRAKVVNNEDKAVGLGDGVYLLSWSADKGRVRLRVYDPGFYFPVEDEASDDGDFPNKVHLAWEFEDDEGALFVRRITFERVALTALEHPEDERRYPYAPDTPSKFTVLMSDGSWELNTIDSTNVLTLEEGAADWAENDEGEEIHNLDLRIDFIPVVHLANTLTLDEGWGESALLRIAQILDDLAATDTDLAVSAAINGAPPLVLSGVPGLAGTTSTYGPGEKMYVGDGKAYLMDTSTALDALIKMADLLQQRLSVVRQLPGSILGRQDPNAAAGESGIHLLLTFGPFRQLVLDYRLARETKYELLPKFAQRLAIAGGEGSPDAPGALDGLPMDCAMAWGPFLPTDLDTLKAMVVALVDAHLISRSTALRLLVEGGLPIEDIPEEIRQAQHEDFEGAGLLADAVNDDAAAAEYLGRATPTNQAAPPAPPEGGPGPLLPPPAGQ